MLRIQAEALTYDDVSLVPAHSTVLPKDVSLETRLTRNLRIRLPIVSAAMDTVSEARLAIAMAQLGGISIIHKNMSAEAQAAQVVRVKTFEAGVIKDPFTVGPDTTIGEVLKLTRARNISGVPVVDEAGQLVGIVTGRDMRFEKKLDDPVRHIMTKKDRLVTVREGASDDEVLGLLHRHRIEKVLVVNDEFALRGLITVKDIQKKSDNPTAAYDGSGRLLTGAAVGVGGDTEARSEALVAGASTIMIGGLFAGTDEAPGDIELYQGRSYKTYRGMGSLGAMQSGSSDRYFQEQAAADKLVPEGIEGRVPYRGSVGGIIHQLVGGLRATMGYVGCATIEEMRAKPKFVVITGAGQRESHVHDVQITKEPPNYRMG